MLKGMVFVLLAGAALSACTPGGGTKDSSSAPTPSSQAPPDSGQPPNSSTATGKEPGSATPDSAPAPSDKAAGPPDVARGFYTAYKSLPPGGGIPDAAGLAKLEPFISPALDDLLKKARAAEDQHAKAHKDEPPLVEGDPFTSLFEGATDFEIGGSSWGGSDGNWVEIKLSYKDGQGKTTSWTDKALFVDVDAGGRSIGWHLDDIEYGGTWSFGNKGKLKDLLRDVISEGGN